MNSTAISENGPVLCILYIDLNIFQRKEQLATVGITWTISGRGIPMASLSPWVTSKSIFLPIFCVI